MTITAKFNGKCRKCGGNISAGETIEWEKGIGASHVECPKKKTEKTPDGTIKISGGSGYGCRGFMVGGTYLYKGQYVTAIESGKHYYREDGISFGVGDESGYVYWANCRPATETEIEPLRQAAEKLETERLRVEELKGFMREFASSGQYPAGENLPVGDTVPVGNGQTIYGGGEWFVIGPELTWFIINNGHDGDDWSRNNVRTGGAGGIGYTLPTTPELTDKILRLTGYNLDAEKTRKEAAAIAAEAAKEAFASTWTLKVTEDRREQWNSRMVTEKAKGKKMYPGDIRKIEAEMGFKMDDLQRAVKLHKLAAWRK